LVLACGSLLPLCTGSGRLVCVGGCSLGADDEDGGMGC
jgi:hypothetical protein